MTIAHEQYVLPNSAIPVTCTFFHPWVKILKHNEMRTLGNSSIPEKSPLSAMTAVRGTDFQRVSFMEKRKCGLALFLTVR